MALRSSSMPGSTVVSVYPTLLVEHENEGRTPSVSPTTVTFVALAVAVTSANSSSAVMAAAMAVHAAASVPAGGSTSSPSMPSMLNLYVVPAGSMTGTNSNVCSPSVSRLPTLNCDGDGDWPLRRCALTYTGWSGGPWSGGAPSSMSSENVRTRSAQNVCAAAMSGVPKPCCETAASRISIVVSITSVVVVTSASLERRGGLRCNDNRLVGVDDGASNLRVLDDVDGRALDRVGHGD